MKKHNFGFGINNDELLRTRNLCCTRTWKPIIFRFAINNGETTYWEREIYFLRKHEKDIIFRFGINNDKLLRTRNLLSTWTLKRHNSKVWHKWWQTIENEKFCTWKWNGITLRFGLNN